MFKLMIFSFVFIGAAFSSDRVHAQDIFQGKTHVNNPLDLRDPFKRKMTKKKTNRMKNTGALTGQYSNISNSLDNQSVDNLKVIGVVIGAERRALVRQFGEGASPQVFYVKEGMKIGNLGAEVKAILPGGIVIVERIRNVYDQDEYLETVIPISED